MTAVSTEAPGDAASYELLFSEAARSLAAQEASLTELRARAGVLLGSTGVVGAFLGTAALTAPPRPGVILGVPDGILNAGIVGAGVLMAAASILFVAVMWPRKWTFHMSSHDLLGTFIEGENPATLPVIHRSLAYFFGEAETQNAIGLERRYRWLASAGGLFIAQMAVWLAVLFVKLVS